MGKQLLNYIFCGNALIKWILYIIVTSLLLPNFMHVPCVSAAEKGKIISIETNSDTFNRGDIIRVWVKVQSFEKGQRHHIVVLNILNENDKAIYDSHIVNEDMDFLISNNEIKKIGPFSFKWPYNIPRGKYRLFVGYRVFPWEPLIEFKGDQWNPPITKVTVK